MAGTARKISTEIELSGEQAFRQALGDAARNVRVLDSDLKAITAEFKATGDAQLYITQRSETLRERILQQSDIVGMLNDKLKDSVQKYGSASAQADGYRIKLNNATAKLFDMRRELETADREAEEFGRDSVKVGRQIENGIGDGAEEAQKSMKGLIEQMQEDIGSIKGSVAFTVTNQVINTVTGAFNNLQNFVTSNQEYRRKVANFEAAARIGNHSI